MVRKRNLDVKTAKAARLLRNCLAEHRKTRRRLRVLRQCRNSGSLIPPSNSNAVEGESHTPRLSKLSGNIRLRVSPRDPQQQIFEQQKQYEYGRTKTGNRHEGG